MCQHLTAVSILGNVPDKSYNPRVRDELSVNVVTAYHDLSAILEAVPPPTDDLLFAGSDRSLIPILLDYAISRDKIIENTFLPSITSLLTSKREKAARILSGGSADIEPNNWLVPLLCVPGFPLVCSEQRRI